MSTPAPAGPYKIMIVEEKTGDVVFERGGLPAERMQSIAGFIRLHKQALSGVAEAIGAAFTMVEQARRLEGQFARRGRRR